LKNEGNFFPINPDKKLTIAVIGENATHSMTKGGGSSELKAQYEILPLDGIKKRFKNANIIYSLGYASGISGWKGEIPSKLNADSLVKAAVDIASKADVVIVIGGLNKNYLQDSEGGDRRQYSLPYGQIRLIEELAKVNKNIGVILISGNAVEMTWLPQVSGVMQAWYLGSDAGNSIADIISGEVNPSGKLPFTFPLKLEDNAAISFGKLSYPGDSINEEYKEGILVGYRWHDTKKIKPLFAFGYGLSYTTFTISNAKSDKQEYLRGEKIKLTCQASNNGNVDGAEVIQVYIGKVKSKVERALKELKGFNKVFIEKADSKNVEITVDVDKLAYYDETSSKWQIEPGEYIIYIGNSSDNISQKLKITIK
jgi:beta-glucosidase